VKVTDRNTLIPLPRVKDMAERPGRPVKGSQGHADRVSLSTEAQQMQQADAERVAELARAISEGRYQVDLERLAEAFVRKELP